MRIFFFSSLEIIHHFQSLIFNIIVKLTGGATKKSDFNARWDRLAYILFRCCQLWAAYPMFDGGEEKRHKEKAISTPLKLFFAFSLLWREAKISNLIYRA